MKNFHGLGLADFRPPSIDEIMPGLAHIRRTQEAVRGVDLLPASTRMMLDLQRSLPQVATLAGTSHLRGVTEALDAARLAGPVGELLGSFQHLRSLTDSLRVAGGVRAMFGHQFLGLADTAHLRTLLEFATRLDGLYPSLTREFGPRGALAWQGAVLGSLRGLERVLPHLPPRAEPVGVVAMLSRARAAFTWATEDAALVPRAAALRFTRHPARAVDASAVRVQLRVDCVRCGDPIILSDLAQTLEGEVLEVSARAFPVCPRCVRETGGDLRRMAEEALSPRPPVLRLIPGGGQGPQSPVGGLRLVSLDDSGDEVDDQ